MVEGLLKSVINEERLERGDNDKVNNDILIVRKEEIIRFKKKMISFRIWRKIRNI